MVMEMEIEIVRTETIKPSSPTPSHLKKFNLSVFDQFSPKTYTSHVFFYPGGRSTVSDRLRALKLSLSGALTRFYPVAGRIVEGDGEFYVECDDGGVDFVETKVNGCHLPDILARPEEEDVGRMLPTCGSGGPHRLMIVRASVFACGGVAVGVGFWHVLMDAGAMCAFLKGWAQVARGDLERSPPRGLNAVASRFLVSAPRAGPSLSMPRVGKCSSRRYVVQGPQIEALRDKLTSAGGERPTRVAVASALTWKCIVNALTQKPGHQARSSVIIQSMNLRRRLEPPISENSLGNMVTANYVESDSLLELPKLVSLLKQGSRDATQNFVTNVQDSEGVIRVIHEGIKKCMTMMARNDTDFYIFNSRCGFGWYEVDFGWGRPAWIGLVSLGVKNVVVMMDASDGEGIEIWVTLSEQDMTFFETNSEFLEFASLNPSA